jgi:hypothetical protein
MQIVMVGAGCAAGLTIINGDSAVFCRRLHARTSAGGAGRGSRGDSFSGPKCDKIQRFSAGLPVIRQSISQWH